VQLHTWHRPNRVANILGATLRSTTGCSPAGVPVADAVATESLSWCMRRLVCSRWRLVCGRRRLVLLLHRRWGSTNRSWVVATEGDLRGATRGSVQLNAWDIPNRVVRILGASLRSTPRSGAMLATLTAVWLVSSGRGWGRGRGAPRGCLSRRRLVCSGGWGRGAPRGSRRSCPRSRGRISTTEGDGRGAARRSVQPNAWNIPQSVVGVLRTTLATSASGGPCLQGRE